MSAVAGVALAWVMVFFNEVTSPVEPVHAALKIAAGACVGQTATRATPRRTTSARRTLTVRPYPGSERRGKKLGYPNSCLLGFPNSRTDATNASCQPPYPRCSGCARSCGHYPDRPRLEPRRDRRAAVAWPTSGGPRGARRRARGLRARVVRDWLAADSAERGDRRVHGLRQLRRPCCRDRAAGAAYRGGSARRGSTRGGRSAHAGSHAQSARRAGDSRDQRRRGIGRRPRDLRTRHLVGVGIRLVRAARRGPHRAAGVCARGQWSRRGNPGEARARRRGIGMATGVADERGAGVRHPHPGRVPLLDRRVDRGARRGRRALCGPLHRRRTGGRSCSPDAG